jgi:integrase/recombinase XerD
MNDLTVTLGKLPARGLIKQYQNDLKLFNEWTNDRPVNVETLQEYFDKMIIDGKAPATIQRHRAAIKKSITIMMGDRLTLAQRAQLDQFFKEVRAPKRDMSVMPEKTLSKTEYRELIARAGYKTGLIIQSLYWTAARVSELVSIRLTDCTVTKNGVTIRIIGKGSRERTVYLSLDLFDKIRAAYRGETYLFETGDGQHMKPISAATMIKRAGKKIGRPDLHPHMMRHSWASLSLEAGVSLPKVSGYLGHSNLQTTTKFYLHGKPDMLEINAVNQLIGG